MDVCANYKKSHSRCSWNKVFTRMRHMPGHNDPWPPVNVCAKFEKIINKNKFMFMTQKHNVSGHGCGCHWDISSIIFLIGFIDLNALSEICSRNRILFKSKQKNEIVVRLDYSVLTETWSFDCDWIWLDWTMGLFFSCSSSTNVSVNLTQVNLCLFLPGRLPGTKLRCVVCWSGWAAFNSRQHETCVNGFWWTWVEIYLSDFTHVLFCCWVER